MSYIIAFVSYTDFTDKKYPVQCFRTDLKVNDIVLVIYAELSGDFPLGDSRQPIYKSLRPFDLVS